MLPPSWRYVRYTLKHKKEDISLTDLGQHCWESSIRANEGKKDSNPNVRAINMVEVKLSQGEKQKKTFKEGSSNTKPINNSY